MDPPKVDLQIVQAVFDIVKNVAVTAATCTGAIVAVLGLSTWKRQLRGTRDLELGRRILAGVHRFRDALQAVRNRVLWPGETALSPDETKGKSVSEIDHLAMQEGYSNRYAGVYEARRDLQNILVDAEAVWGHEVRKACVQLYEFDGELAANVDTYLGLSAAPGELRSEQKPLLATAREVINDRSTQEKPDDYTSRLHRSVAELEELIRRRMAL